MRLIAKVLNFEINEKDLNRESCCDGDRSRALRRLIDRCLLLAKAFQEGITVSEDEYDIALFNLLDEEKPFGLPPGSLQRMDAAEMETLLHRNIIIKKYLAKIYPDSPVSEDKLREFYKEQRENFCCEEMVRCSHILIKGEDALGRAQEIRSRIQNKEDFLAHCKSLSDCPSNKCCGDLGYFPRGRLFKEIENVAFGLKLWEISQPFKSPEGYHILMLTDRKTSAPIPFEEIKLSLSLHIQQMEREYFIMRHISDLYEEYRSQILIFSDAGK